MGDNGIHLYKILKYCLFQTNKRKIKRNLNTVLMIYTRLIIIQQCGKYLV